MEHTKGKLEVDGYTYLKDSNCKVVATTNHINGLDFEQQKANAKEIVRRWNAFEDGGIVEELKVACDVGLDAINALLKVDTKFNTKNNKSLKEIIKFVEAALAKS